MILRFIQSFILAVSIFNASYEDDFKVEPQPAIVAMANQFPAKGILKQKENGYLYLDVSNEYIAALLPLIEAKGKMVPPQHYSSKKGIGAHISVMYENEQIENEIWEIKEVGQEFSFTVHELRTVKLNRENQMKKLWILAVDAPELEYLRVSYGLKPLLNGHSFHITLGTQVPGTAQPAEEEHPGEAA